MFSFFKATYQVVMVETVESLRLSAKQLPSAAAIADSKERIGILEELILSYIETLRVHGKFEGEDGETDPTLILWTLFFAAQHYQMLGEKVSMLFEMFNDDRQTKLEFRNTCVEIVARQSENFCSKQATNRSLGKSLKLRR